MSDEDQLATAKRTERLLAEIRVSAAVLVLLAVIVTIAVLAVVFGLVSIEVEPG